MKSTLITPGGNPTLLIENLDNSLSKKQKINLSKKALQNNQCEQVAFIEKSQEFYKCQMMGNELCINAIRSLGYWVYNKTQQTKFQLLSSGTNEKFELQIFKPNIVQIKFKLQFKESNLTKNLKLIQLDGIAHFSQLSKKSKSEAELKKLLQKYISENPICQNYQAIGLITYQKNSADTFIIQPLVSVKETNSYILESACGSGSIAVLIANNLSEAKIIQPSQTIYHLKKSKTHITLKSEVQ